MKTQNQNLSLEMACQHLESIGCDGNAIELREMFDEHAALVAVAEAAAQVEFAYQASGDFRKVSERLGTLAEALTNLAAARNQNK